MKKKIKADNVASKKIFFNGKQLSGVQDFHVQYSARQGHTLAHISLIIKNGSFNVKNDNIYFEDIANA